MHAPSCLQPKYSKIKLPYVIFLPPQNKIDCKIAIIVYDNNTGQYLSRDRKNYVKFFGVLIDGNLKWSHHIMLPLK